MATSYKCPNCAANCVFDADQQKMSCEYCGAAISPEDVAGDEVAAERSDFCEMNR